LIYNMEYKYSKYKSKYINLKMKQVGGYKQHILLFGVSSSGKSTISKYFVNHGYVHIGMDDSESVAQKNFYKLLDTNQYYANKKFKEMYIANHNEVMHDMSKNHTYVIYDVIDIQVSNFYKNPSDIFIILVYASLSRLADNIYSRRIDDPRGLFVFDQFANLFVRADPSDSNIIDYIDKNNFIEKLKSKLKYLFESEDDLINFATKTFLAMDIPDDNGYPIKLRNTFKYDYLINTSDKTPDQIFEQLKNDLSNKIFK